VGEFDMQIYHSSGSRSYGKTKVGAYMCEKESRRRRFPRAQDCTTRGDLISASATLG
jgi:hypothetical protein